MKLLHTVKLSVFVYPEEDEQAIRQRLIELVPFNLEEEKIKVEQQTAEGFQEKRIKIFNMMLSKEKHTTGFLNNLLEKLPEEEKRFIHKTAETRVDDEFNIFIRLDKPKLLEKNQYWLTDHGNCYHITMNIACFPRKKEVALEIVKKIFKA